MAKLKTQRTNGSKRIQTKLTGVSMTDKSMKKASDINVMVQKFKSTGIAPRALREGQFADVSDIPSISDAFELAHAANEAFMSLPARVRKLMNNDASKLEEFIAEEKNKEICLEYGLISEKKKPETKKPQEVVIVENKSKKES